MSENVSFFESLCWKLFTSVSAAEPPECQSNSGRRAEQRVLPCCAREDVVSAALVQENCSAAVASFRHTKNR